ncbi:MAG: ABC transporter permease [Lacunisphaera sp.]
MKLLRRIRSLFRKDRLDAEMAEEMRLHLELQAERNRAVGMSAEEAHYAAQREFGNVGAIQQRAREGRGWVWLETLGRDLRFASRRLRRTPTFTATALLTLALCIGANTAIFAVVDALVLRPLPFPEPARLMTVINSYPGAGYPHAGPSIPDYFERREAIQAFANVELFQPLSAVMGEPGSVRQIEVARVTPDFFATLGVPLAKGKMFTDAELTYQTAGVVVLTDEFWRSQFGADPDILGKTLIADGLPSTIIGVLSPGFRFLSSRAQFFKPLAFNPPERELANRHNSPAGTIMIARLASGATQVEAQAQLDALDNRQAKVDPKGALLGDWGYHSIVRSLQADVIREVRPTLLLLQGGVLVLLLIGAANLTNLLLVRISGRSRELAVRQAIGARRSHLAREIWLETTLLALGGGTLGLAVGAAGVRLLMTLGANQLPLGTTITFDGRVTAIVLIATLVLGGLLAVAPIWFVRRLSINAQLQSETTGSLLGGASQRLRETFSMAQIALAFVMLCGAGLLGLSLNRALAQPVGFTPENVLVGQTSLPWKGYRTERQQAYFAYRLEQAMAALPGEVRFAVSDGLPFSGMRSDSVTIETPAGNRATAVQTHLYASVTSDYWRTLRIPLRRGQLLGKEQYALKSPRVCVIDQTMADADWPGVDPIGQRLCFGPTFNPANALTVIGVVGNVKQAHVVETQPKGMIYLHYGQFPTGWMRLVMRGRQPPAAMGETLRKKIREPRSELLVTEINTMEQLIDDSLLMRRSPALLAMLFAAIALVLCAIGTYGVLACAVSYRRREIGVRLALGAMPRQIVVLFLTMGTKLLLSGAVLGLIGAWATGQAMRSFLFEVAPFSPLVVVGGAGLMGSVVLVAIVIPAVRAATVDPCETLRHE